MRAAQNESEQDRCSFCHWHANGTTVLLKSHDGRAFICDVCVMTCVTRITEAKAKGKSTALVYKKAAEGMTIGAK
jgi:hypothetical protein